MNKIVPTELHRLFLIDALPEPVTAASSHLQIYDRYIEATRIRIRQVRDPYTNSWTRLLQQVIPALDDKFAVTNVSEIHLNDAEFAVFERFVGHETRKNRYFHEFDQTPYSFDVYLGKLRGLHTAKPEFGSREDLAAYVPPKFAVIEVTNNRFFAGESLATREFADVQAEISRLRSVSPEPVDE